MKLLLCFILMSILNVSGSIYSQNTIFDFTADGKTVKEVFKDIESQSQFRFLYNDDFDGLNKIVSLNSDDKCIDELLKELLVNANLAYRELENNLIVITPVTLEEQEGHRVTGTVRDVDGVLIPGATVLVDGTTIGVVTGPDGSYSLTAPGPTSVLIISFVGYTREVVPIDGRAVIDITIYPELLALDEVIVVGYGTQRVGTITGSVSRVDASDLARVPTPTVAQSLQGQTSGVFIKNVTGQPGDSKVQINIRGFGEPLIILDGMPASLAEFQDLDPNDIEEMNVLKDAASAAVYGARAGNGVIIIRTKRGKLSEPQFHFTSDAAGQFLLPFSLPEPIHSHQWMEFRNWTDVTEGRAPTFSRELVELYRQHADGSEPILYPNVNIYEEALKDYAPMYNNSLSVRGGTESVSYYFSGSMLHQRDILVSDETRYNRFSLRSNTDAKLTDRLTASLDLSFQNRDYLGPRSTMEGEGSWDEGPSITGRLRRWRPFHPIAPIPGHPDKPRGAVGGATNNPLNMQRIDLGGYNSYETTVMDTKLSFDYDLPYGFNTRYLLNYSRNDRRDKIYQKRGPEYNYNEETGEAFIVRHLNSREFVRQGDFLTENLNMQWFLNFDRIFAENHAITGLFVAEYLSDIYDAFEAWRLNYEFEMDHLFAGPEGSQYNTSARREGGSMGYIGRLSYNYAGKYTIETSARYDGSPRFPVDTRWGFFPSASVSWLITEEPFMQRSASLGFLNIIKLRASYGRLGYDRAGDWQYLASYRFAEPYVYEGNTLIRGIRTDAIPNPYITWEKMDLANIGVDFVLFGGILDGLFEVYQRDRTDVLGTRIRELPNIVGASMPQENYREYQNRGWDFMLNYNRKEGLVNYRIGGNISWNREVVNVIDEPDWASQELMRRNSQIGKASDRVLLYPSDGLFRSQEEIDNWACIDGRNNATIQPGDVKWIDTNGDGRITAEDMIAWNRGDMPRFTGGLNAYASYGGFELFMAWQGAALFGFDLRGGGSELVRPWCCDGMPFQHHYYDSYIPEGSEWMPANTDAKYPRSLRMGNHRNWSTNQEFWWINGRYIRLRQLQLSYNIPRQFTNRFGIDRFKIYVSGYNLLTFSENDFTDPELDMHQKQHRGFTHPQMGSLHFGIELNF